MGKLKTKQDLEFNEFTLLINTINLLTMKIRIPGWARSDAIPDKLYHFQDSEGKSIWSYDEDVRSK